MLPNRMQLTRQTEEQLKRLKTMTGLTPNIAARLAFYRSIESGFRYQSNKKQFSKLIRQAIVNQIDKDLKTRELRGEDIRYEQIMYFDYSDGSHMSSLAFVIGGKEIEAKIKKCNLSMLPFYQKSDTSYCIEVPNLTAKEIRHLSEKMPSSVQKMIPDEVGITDKDVENFCKNYKYYPTFTEVEII